MRSAPRKQRETGVFKEVWKAINDLIDYAREISPQQSMSQGVIVDRKSNGTGFKIIPSEVGESGLVKQFRVQSQEDDYLVCKEFDGTTEGETVNVAKPHGLRVSGWNGQFVIYTLEAPLGGAPLSVTYTKVTASHRTSFTAPNTSEHQAIRPFYVNGQTVIFASRSENGTGVSDAPDWIDLNTDGRAYAKIA